MEKLQIDVNCDIAEGRGTEGRDWIDAMMPYISSANIACNFHAGDPAMMLHAIRSAKQHGVQIGAHPGYPDREGFGRRNLAMSPDELYAIISYQMAALKGMSEAQEARMCHVKAHGALYNLAAADLATARVLVLAIQDLDAQLTLMGLPNSAMEKAAQEAGLSFAAELFADRAFDEQGLLVDRSLPGAVLLDHEAMIQRVLQMLQYGRLYSLNGKLLPVRVQTLCIHGDHPGALEFAQKLKKSLDDAAISIHPFSNNP
ncbi:MAG: LamB/YcsF family protein [Cyclobacteriaceae bacterium]|nr:LamB/YcsF family protein [Cyclobacteriaceae bacterium]